MFEAGEAAGQRRVSRPLCALGPSSGKSRMKPMGRHAMVPKTRALTSMNGKLLAWIVCFAWLFLVVIVFLFRPMLEDFNLWSVHWWEWGR